MMNNVVCIKNGFVSDISSTGHMTQLSLISVDEILDMFVCLYFCHIFRMFLLQNWQRYNASKYFTGIFGALCRPIYAFFSGVFPKHHLNVRLWKTTVNGGQKLAKIWGLSVKL